MSFFGKPKTQTIAIVDVGSGSVGAAIAELRRDGPPIVRAFARAETPLGADRGAEKLAADVLETARTALTDLISHPDSSSASLASKHKRPAPNANAQSVEHIAVFLPAPWSELYVGNVRLAEEKPIEVTPQSIEAMVADYVKREQKEGEGRQVIERSAVGIRINGYMVEDIPQHASATRIELTVISATAPSSFIASLSGVIREGLGHRPTISFHATSVAASHALSVIVPEEEDYMLCNGEGEVTEILLVIEHIPVGCATAPVGCNLMLRTLGAHADMARAEASSALALAKQDHSPMQEKLDQTISSAQKECSEGFRIAAQALIEQFGAPQKVYTLGYGAEAQWYAESIASAPFLKPLFPSGVTVENIAPPRIEPFLGSREKSGSTISTPPTSSASLERSNDIFLALEAVFCDSRFDKNKSLSFETLPV